MTILTDCVLVESKSARENQIKNVSHDRANEIFSKIKTLYVTLRQGVGCATTERVVEFYETKTNVVKSALRRYRQEFESDGLKTLKGRQLKSFKDVSVTMAESSKVPSLIIWTPRAALRLGMVLRDCALAASVRTSLLDAVEKAIPAQNQAQQLLKLELELAKTHEHLVLTTSAITLYAWVWDGCAHLGQTGCRCTCESLKLKKFYCATNAVSQ